MIYDKMTLKMQTLKVHFNFQKWLTTVILYLKGNVALSTQSIFVLNHFLYLCNVVLFFWTFINKCEHTFVDFSRS